MRVLVIEDDGATRAVLISTLRGRRHDVVACPDAEAAWAAITSDQTAPFELAIVDVGLPGQDGVAFCQQFRRHATGRNAVLLLVTADERPGTLEAALDAGVHDYLLKPIDRRTLSVRIAIAEQRSLANATSRYSREALGPAGDCLERLHAAGRRARRRAVPRETVPPVGAARHAARHPRAEPPLVRYCLSTDSKNAIARGSPV